MPYYSGQGKILLAQRDTSGNPKAFRYIGKTANGAKVGLATTTQTRKEAESGQRLVAARYITEKNATLEFELEDWTRDNLAFALWGTSASVVAGTVTVETLPSDLVAGDLVSLAHVDVSSVVITDSAGTPATLEADTDYRVWNAKTGTIEIIDPATFTQPFKAAYSYAQSYSVPMFSQVPGNWWFRFEGLNTQDSNAPVLVELYNVNVDPLAELMLKAEDITTFKFSGSALYDETKVSDTDLGVFGRVRTLS